MFKTIVIFCGFIAIFIMGAVMASEMIHMSNVWITNVEREALK